MEGGTKRQKTLPTQEALLTGRRPHGQEALLTEGTTDAEGTINKRHFQDADRQAPLGGVRKPEGVKVPTQEFKSHNSLNEDPGPHTVFFHTYKGLLKPKA